MAKARKVVRILSSKSKNQTVYFTNFGEAIPFFYKERTNQFVKSIKKEIENEDFYEAWGEEHYANICSFLCAPDLETYYEALN